jgi:electron transport complex protein RnfE
MSLIKEFNKGIIKENPTFIQLLGMCPTLAVTTSVSNAIGMGLSATVVLACSNIAISMLRKVIPSKVRIPAYVVVIAGFVTLIDMTLKAFFPDLSSSLGIFIPLIVVNCIILARAEAFASKNTVAKSAADGLGMGIGFTCALFLISTIRELLGNGTFLGMSIFGASFKPAIMMIMPPGAFLVLGTILAVINLITDKRGKKGEAK